MPVVFYGIIIYMDSLSLYLSIYLSIYLFVCWCVCVLVCWVGAKTNQVWRALPETLDLQFYM
jgi:hypothetical protein